MAKIYRDIDDPIELEVLKENAQLGNVPNVTTNNQTPTWSMATTLANIVSGETLTKIMGKISKAINDIISHIGNKSNPHGVTKSQVGLGNVENKSSKDILNELEIGGRNLFINSGKLNGSMMGSLGTLSYSSVKDEDVPSNQCLECSIVKLNTTTKGPYFKTSESKYISKLKVGDTCTVSVYVKCNKDIPIVYSAEFMKVSKTINVTTSWQKVVITGTVDHVTGSGLAITFYSTGFEVGDILYLSSPKVELGNKATDWTPAPEDYEHILTLNKNGSKIGSYSPLNDSTINITVPTKTSELTNDSGYKTTDNNTTYTLTKSGSTISLTGSDGSKTSVTDSNTTYTLSSFGVTATAAELNKLDGCTATVTELNYVDGVTSNIQTQLNNKLSTTGTAAKATADASGQNIADTYIKGLSVNGRTITYTKGDGGTGTITTQDTNTTYSQATSTTLGLVKIGYTENGKNYPVELNTSGQMYVNVPWTDTNTTYGLASTSANGLLKQLSGSTSQFMRGDGIWSTIDYNSLINKPTIPSGVQVIDNLTSSSTTASLSANQGRILKGYLDKKVVVSSTQPSGQQTGDTWYQII